jgi:hypothetical protein
MVGCGACDIEVDAFSGETACDAGIDVRPGGPQPLSTGSQLDAVCDAEVDARPGDLHPGPGPARCQVDLPWGGLEVPGLFSRWSNPWYDCRRAQYVLQESNLAVLTKRSE